MLKELKKSEKLIYRILILFTVILFFSVKLVKVNKSEFSAIVLNEFEYKDGGFISPLCKVSEGEYSCQIVYETGRDTILRVDGDSDEETYINLYAGSNLVNETLKFKYNNDILSFRCQDAEESGLKISEIIIDKGEIFYKDTNLFAVIFILIILGTVLILLKCSEVNELKAVLIIYISVFATLIPVLNSYLINVPSEDLGFHLSRIEAIYEGLKIGDFPVLDYGNGYYEYGILASMYPSYFLYPFALLRFLGISLISAYQSLVIVVNILSAVSMYVCLKTVAAYECEESTDMMLPAILTALFLLSPYRLNDMYIRSALGETTAFIFIPLIITSLYLMYKNKGTVLKKAVFLTAGFAGLLNCHLLSVSIMAFVGLLTLAVYCKKFLIGENIKAAVVSVIASAVLSVPFLFHFLYFSRNVEFNFAELDRNISKSAVSLYEMFTPVLKNDEVLKCVANYTGLGLTGLLAIIAVIVIIKRCYSNEFVKDNSFAVYLFVFSMAVTVLCLNIVPWQLIMKIEFLNNFLKKLQFLFRLLIIPSCFMPLCLMLLLAKNKGYEVILRKAFYVCAALILFVVPMSFQYLTDSHILNLEDGGMTLTRTDEYLMTGSEESPNTKRYAVLSDYESISASNYTKNNTVIEFDYSCSEDGEYVELPMYNYPGFKAVEVNSEGIVTPLNIEMGEGNRIRVMLNKCEDVRRVKVYYKPPMTINFAK